MLPVYVNRNPLISVVMASYNRADYLQRSLSSLFAQSFSDWELVFVDDGSSDNTFQVVDRYIPDYNIRYIKQRNNGLPLARNTGILASSGKYLTFLDSDDEFTEKHLEIRFEFLRKNPLFDLIYGGVKIIGDPYVADKTDLSKKIHLNDCAIGATFFGRRRFFLDMEGFRNLKYSEDSDFLERAEMFYNIKKVEFPTYVYHRNTPDSICNNII